jgi:hypothetical protein
MYKSLSSISYSVYANHAYPSRTTDWAVLSVEKFPGAARIQSEEMADYGKALYIYKPLLLLPSCFFFTFILA